MKKFGGPAKKKKACKLRICSQSSVAECTELPIYEVDVTIQKLTAVVDKFRKLATRYLATYKYYNYNVMSIGHQTSHVPAQPVLSKEEVLKASVATLATVYKD